jgi:hypothetical protein
MLKPSLKTRVQDLYLFLRFDYGETNLSTESGQILEYIRGLEMNVDEANTFVNNQAKLAWVALLRNSKPNQSIDDNVLEWFSDSYNPFTLSEELMKPKPKGRLLRDFQKLFKNYYDNAETSVAVKNQVRWNAKELITFVHFGLNTEQVREVLKTTPPGTIALFFNSEKGSAYGARTGVLLATRNSDSVSVTPPLRPTEVPIVLKSIADRWKDSAMLYNVKGKFYSVEKVLRKVRPYMPNERFKRVGARVAEEGGFSGESKSDQNLARWLV